MSYVAATREQIAALEAEIAAHPDPRSIKLRALREVLRAYDGDTSVPMPVPAKVPDPFPLLRSPSASGERKREHTSTARRDALRIASEVLTRSTGPVTTAAIYYAVARAGVSIGGENPKNNLSAMLHHAPEFESHGRQGWTLKPASEVGKENEPNGGFAVGSDTPQAGRKRATLCGKPSYRLRRLPASSRKRDAVFRLAKFTGLVYT